MNWIRQQRRADGTRYGAAVGGLSLVASAAAALWIRAGLPRPGCTFRELSGIPCVTCGSTRMAEALLRADVLGAAALNPLVFTLAAAVGLWSALSLLTLIPGVPVWRPQFHPGDRRRLWLALGILTIANWAYLILGGI